MTVFCLSGSAEKVFFSFREGRLVVIATGLLLTFVITLLLLFPPFFVQLEEFSLYDQLLADRAKPPQTEIPVIVGIDEQSLEAYGQWPWPRYRLAQLVDRLRLLGADVIAFDFLMPEPDRTSPDVIMAERQRDLEIAAIPGSFFVFQDLNSRSLAESLAKSQTILSYHFDFAEGVIAGERRVPAVPSGMVVAAAAGSDTKWPEPTGIIRSVPELTAAVKAEGFTNAGHDFDGVLRRIPLLLRYDGKYYPSLSLGAILLASSERKLEISCESTDTILNWNNRHIPLDRNGNLLVDFRTPKTNFSYFSAREILSGKSQEGVFRGKIVLVGSWAKGLDNHHLVPSGRLINALEVQATVIDNIISGKFINRPSWARGAELFAILFWGTVTTFMLSRYGFGMSLLTVAIGTGTCYWGVKELLFSQGLFLSPLLPMATPVIITVVLSLLKYGIEARKVRQRNRDLLSAQLIIHQEEEKRREAEEELRASEQQYRYLFEQNPMPMLIYERVTLRILAVNEAFPRDYGYSVDEALAMFLPELYPNEEKGPILELASRQGGQVYIGEWHHKRKDGSLIDIMTRSNDIVYQGLTARIAVMTDISDRKQAEEELQTMNETLDQRIRDRTAELESKNAELAEFNKLFVDREYRINELKEQVKKLETEQGHNQKRHD